VRIDQRVLADDTRPRSRTSRHADDSACDVRAIANGSEPPGQCARRSAQKSRATGYVDLSKNGWRRASMDTVHDRAHAKAERIPFTQG